MPPLVIPAGAGFEAPAGNATWPAPESFAETAATRKAPWTPVLLREKDGGPAARRHVLLTRLTNDTWFIDGVFGPDAQPELYGCASLPCPWPSWIRLRRPLAETAELPAHVLADVVYARTLLAFEGPLRLPSVRAATRYDARAMRDEFPADLWRTAYDNNETDLAPFLEPLRRYYPPGFCSRDSHPQQVALVRARAAAQSGKTGWTVQGWLETVGYWSSSRNAWSSIGQHHPDKHLTILESVGVDPKRLFLGLVIELPGFKPAMHIRDARRVVWELGVDFADRLRALAADPAVDPFNRAVLTAIVADVPFTADPLYAKLPPASQALLKVWSR